MPSAASLTIKDKISDPMMTELDPSLLEFRPMSIDFGTGKDDPLNWTSQMLSDPMRIEFGRSAPEERREDDDMDVELELDFGEDDGPSIEIGRRERATRPIEDDLIGDDMKFQNADNLNVDFGDDDERTRTRLDSLAPSLVGNELPHDLDNEAMMLDNQDDLLLPADDTVVPTDGVAWPADLRSQRDSDSPLSSVHSSALRNFDATNLYEEEEEASMHQQAHKAKKRRIIQADADTVIPTAQIKQQQADRSAILKPASFLSRDPLLLNLINMKRNGDFVSSIMGDGRAKGWAPELRGILSIEMVRKSGELKRKRDSGVADVDDEEFQPGMGKMPQLEIPEDEDDVALGVEGIAVGGDTTIREPSEIVNLPAEDGFQPVVDYEDARARQESDEEVSPIREQFDDTIAPLLYPMEQGAVSLGTQHAVHLLRDRFGSSADDNPSQQKKANILFQEMLPETTTSKVDATKMFFEVLVLATKDAVKVNQSETQLGGPIRIRGKRGLWGAWAEKEAGGEICGQDAAPSVAANA